MGLQPGSTLKEYLSLVDHVIAKDVDGHIY